MSNEAGLAQQLTKIDLAVLPETKSQGLFHQIQEEVTSVSYTHLDVYKRQPLFAAVKEGTVEWDATCSRIQLYAFSAGRPATTL